MSLNVLSDFAVQFAFPLTVPKEFSLSSRTFEPATSSSWEDGTISSIIFF